MNYEVIETKVLPIEYDANTKAYAEKLKKILEEYPEVFNEFLTNNSQFEKISFVNPQENTLFIENVEDMLSSVLKSISEENTLEELHQCLFLKEDEVETLLFLLGDENFTRKTADKEYRKLYLFFAATIYFSKRNQNSEWKKYLTTMENATLEASMIKELEEEHRFAVLNMLLASMTGVMKGEDTPNYHDSFFLENSTAIWKFLSTKMKFQMESAESNSVAPSIEFEEMENIIKRFLATIDPSLKWLEKYQTLRKENKIIYIDENDEEAKEVLKEKLLLKKIRWCQFELEEYGGYILAPLEGTLEDCFGVIHEFSHLISNEGFHISPIPFTLKEFAPLFFEKILADYLIKNTDYKKEEIEAIEQKREDHTTGLLTCALPLLQYINLYLTEGKVDEEKELAKALEQRRVLQDVAPELSELLPDEKTHLDNTCDFYNKAILRDPYYFLDSYKYIMGQYLAEDIRRKTFEDDRILPIMISVTENLSSLSPYEVFNQLGFEEQLGKSSNDKPKAIKKLPLQ